MGGDEFIAIAGTGDSAKISAMMEEFQSCINEKNQAIPDLHLSIAYGYASCSPKEYNIEKIYQIADNRMYAHKQETKRLNGGHGQTGACGPSENMTAVAH